MAGFGAAHAAHEAGVRPVMYDMHDHIGGHTASYEFPGRMDLRRRPARVVHGQ